MTTIQSWSSHKTKQKAKSSSGQIVDPIASQMLYKGPNASGVRKFEYPGGKRYISRIGLNMSRNSQIAWEEIAIDKQNGLVIANSASSPISGANVASSLGLERGVVVDVDPFEGKAPFGPRLYPAFGEVIDVDWVQGRVYVRLLEAPFSCLLSLPLYTKDGEGTITGVGLLRQKGQLFAAQATLAAKDQSEFRLGNIRVIEQEEPESFYDAIRDLAEPTAKFRF